MLRTCATCQHYKPSTLECRIRAPEQLIVQVTKDVFVVQDRYKHIDEPTQWCAEWKIRTEDYDHV